MVLRPAHWDLWLAGSVEEALGLVRICDDTLVVGRASEFSFKREAAESEAQMI